MAVDEIATKIAAPTDDAPDKAAIEVTVESGKTYWWCACGLSKDQPFCDGSHKVTQTTPMKYKATEAGTKSFCGCKKTTTPPFCDRSHASCES
jgi:CDGSH-type Zn-finger protein